jgi:hypothetical protein
MFKYLAAAEMQIQLALKIYNAAADIAGRMQLCGMGLKFAALPLL